MSDINLKNAKLVSLVEERAKVALGTKTVRRLLTLGYRTITLSLTGVRLDGVAHTWEEVGRIAYQSSGKEV